MSMKAIMMTAVFALTLSACAHKSASGCCGAKDKNSCSESKECPMSQGADCDHCKDSSDNASSK